MIALIISIPFFMVLFSLLLTYIWDKEILYRIAFLNAMLIIYAFFACAIIGIIAGVFIGIGETIMGEEEFKTWLYSTWIYDL
jgi:hypothetical protein